MLIPRLITGMFSVSLLGAAATSSQDYPNKPIRVVTSGVGGGTDFTARLIAQRLTGVLGQQVIVDNRVTGFMPGEIVSKAPPDGYTVLVYGTGFYYGYLLRTNSSFPYDPVRDFSPITLVSQEPNVLVVTPSLPVKSVKELIALAKAKPGELNFASSGVGTSSHITAELFKAMAGVNIVHIPYKSTATAFTDLISGQVQLRFSGAAGAAPHIKSGRLRALAVTTAQPSALAPGLPTVAATVPGYEAAGITGVWAPTKTPEAIIKRLNQEIARMLNREDVKEKFLSVGLEVMSSSPEQFGAIVRADIDKLGKVIKDAGIKAD